MKPYCDIPKRRGSCNTTRGGAVFHAVGTNALNWKLERGSTLSGLRTRKRLEELLAMTAAELRDHPHGSYADHEARGAFGWLEVHERRGYWRVVANGCEDGDRVEA